jgi:hypothetical protein
MLLTPSSSLAQLVEALRYIVSIPDCVITIFHLLNLSDRIMALGSTRPVREMSTRRITWG